MVITNEYVLATNEHELHESIRSELSRQVLVFFREIRGLKISGINNEYVLATNKHELHESIRSESSRQALVFLCEIRGLKNI